MAQSPYPIRLPGNLRSLLEIEAAKHGQSLASYIVGACWAQLERHGSAETPQGDLVAVPIFPHAKPGDEGYGLTRLRAFRGETVATELTAAGLEPAGVEPAPVCMACEGSTLEGQGKSAGMWACQDVSCSRYGIEVKR